MRPRVQKRIISLAADGWQSNLRAAAMILDAERLLVGQEVGQTFYFLLGRRVEVGESNAEAVRRELHEDLQIERQGERLVGLQEQVFPSDRPSHHFHEVACFYELSLPKAANAALNHGPLLAMDGAMKLAVPWLPQDERPHVDLRPVACVPCGANCPHRWPIGCTIR